ncbi:MAG: polyprenol monophosphomannose synthase [bacterium]|jgi:dolichol-phosphate mannosyltransferase|nr:polyprenol monophosphomannose synthase [bacterium]
MTGLVIIPTYNERENIVRIARAVLAVDKVLSVLVVDDNSPDGTAQAVESFMEDELRIHLISRPSKLGLGSAYVRGFQWALKRPEIEYVFEMDADFSHDPADLKRFLADINDYDLVLGSRYIHGVRVVNWPFYRLALSRGANLYTRIITGMPVMDATGGFKCFRREVLEAIPLERIRSDGYSFQIEMNYQAWRRGFRIKEIPIVFSDRRLGQSKMGWRIIWEAVWMVWRLRFIRLNGGRRVASP